MSDIITHDLCPLQHISSLILCFRQGIHYA